MDTFLVRIWTEAEGAAATHGPATAEAQGPAAPRLQGTVRHVRTGREWRFGDSVELLATLASASRPSVPAGTRPATRNRS